MSGKFFFYVFTTLICLNQSVLSQDYYQLDLQKSLEIAKEKSHSMLILRQNLMITEYELKAATNKFKTNIDLSIHAPNYVEAIKDYTTPEGVSYYSSKTIRYASNLQINQPLPTDGNIFIRSGLINLDDYDADTNSFRFNTRIGFKQPLEAFYSYNNIQSEFKRANLNYERSHKRLLRAELDLVYDVSRAFYQLLSANEREKIAQMDLDRQQISYQTAANKFEAGLIRETEALQMEIDLGSVKNSYDIAVVNSESQLNNLKVILGLSLQDSVSIIGDFDYKELFIDVELAVQYGLENRLEIREREIAIQLSDIQIKKKKADRFVKGDISAYYDFVGFGYNTLGSPAFENAFQDLQSRPANRGISLNVYIPILDWGVNKSLQQAAEASKQSIEYSLDLDKLRIEKEIRNTVNQLHSSLNRLQLLVKNVELAEKNFEISRARFTNGDIDAQTLALDRLRLNDAYKSRLESYIDYKLFVADLTRKTFYDFEKGIELTH